MNEIIYPTVDLYLYQLRSGLGDSKEEIAKRRQKFFSILPDKLQEKLAHTPTEIETNYQTLLPPGEVFNFKTELNNYQLAGYYYPVLLEDTYGLLYDCSVNEQDQPQKLSCLRYLKEKAPVNQGNLGQTWSISAIIPDNFSGKTEELAKEIYLNFWQEEEPKLTREWSRRKQFKFSGAEIFEVSQPPENWHNLQQNRHLLIFLYRDRNSFENGAYFYDNWLKIWCCRNKIIFTYQQCQFIKKELEKGFQNIRNTIPFVQQKTDLNNLQELLKDNLETFHNYVINLKSLEVQQQTININLDNYQAYCESLSKAAQKMRDPDHDLQALNYFTTIVREKYQKQVKKDYESLKPGLEILSHLTETIRAIVETEQAKGEKRLEHIVESVGVGLGAAAIVSAAVQNPVEKIIKIENPQKPLTEAGWHILFIVIVSVLFGSLSSLLTWLFVRRKP